MPEKINIFASLIKPKQRNDLLAIYRDYLCFSLCLERAHRQGYSKIWAEGLIAQFLSEDKTLPWGTKIIGEKEKEAFRTAVSGKYADDNNCAFVLLNHTDRTKDADYKRPSFFSPKYETVQFNCELPCDVERYVIVYPTDTKVKDLKFIVDGKYCATYTDALVGEKTLGSVINDDKVQSNLRILFNLCDNFLGMDEFSQQKTRSMVYDTLAANACSSIENRILELLGSYADSTQKICKTIYDSVRKSDGPLQLAQEDGLLVSAQNMQDYINIRNLMHHQWDTLDSIGNFNAGLAQQNADLRDTYLLSYNNICNKTLVQRIRTYSSIASEMLPMLRTMHTNFLFREPQESNNKFMDRLKQFCRNNPNMPVLIVTNHPFESDKQRSLIANIEKLFPDITILDHPKFQNIQHLRELDSAYRFRGNFLKLYRILEKNMIRYCLSRGYDFNRGETWDFFRKNVFDENTNSEWAEFRQLRNDLSHNYMSDELRQRLLQSRKSFTDSAYKLYRYVRSMTPRFKLVHDNIFHAVHSDGAEVTIDFENRKILKYVDANGREKKIWQPEEFLNKYNPESTPKIKIVAYNHRVQSCEFENHLIVDFKRRKVIFPDGTREFFDLADRNVIVQGDKRLYMGKNFAVSRFNTGKYNYTIQPGDSFLLSDNHRITTDAGNCITRAEIKANDERLTVDYDNSGKVPMLIFGDGTKLLIHPNRLELEHNGVTLQYNTRNTFLGTYDKGSSGSGGNTGSNIPINGGTSR